SSTTNNRIERLWVDVGSDFVRAWRAFFTQLENLHMLDPTNEQHLWLLHTLFLAEINDDCSNFVEMWNNHKISGIGHYQTPLGMELLGRTEHGEYVDNFADVHPDILQRYYGTDDDQEEQRGSGSGAGSSSHADYDDNNLTERILDDQTGNVRHDPIEPPANNSPFMNNPALEDLLLRMIEDPDSENIMPPGFGVLETEWEDATYPTFQTIKMRGGKFLDVPLPPSVWWPRTVRWCQALAYMLLLLDN
ncbi:hypothetical protein BDZ89DRAFT_961624, partial [Hymenopellis radicata]